MAKHGLTRSEGSTATGRKLWGLTPLGLAAAAEVLPTGTVLGGIARSAGRSGAPHAMAVNETFIALIRPRPDGDSQEHGAGPAGIGSITTATTEASHHLPSAGRNRATVRADGVLRAPEAGLPVLLIEVDRGTETAAAVAGKFESYLRFFRLTAKDRTGKEQPVWRTLYPPTGREGYPPIAIVYTGRPGPVAIRNRMAAVEELTRQHWQGHTHGPFQEDGVRLDGWTDYADAIPILAVALADLQAQGPHAAVWLRHGHHTGHDLVEDRLETLADALDNPHNLTAYQVRYRAHDQARQERYAREEAERRRAREEAADEWLRAAEAERARKAAVEPPPPRCRRCGGPLAGPDDDGRDYGIPAPDGTHCAACRSELARPWLLRTLFPRRPT